MAVPTIQITGSVVAPDGSLLTSGIITAELSQPGSVLDGAVSVRVVGKISGTITAGAVPADFDLVPNASITPAGTYYRVTIEGRTADGEHYRSAPPEKWQLAASPSSVDIGAVPRLSVVPGVALGLPLATASAPGAVQLAGDLGGTAAAPTVPALAGKVTSAGGDASATVVTATGSTTARTMAAIAADAELGRATNYRLGAGLPIVDFATGESWTFSGTAGGSLAMLTSPKLSFFDRSARLVANASAGATARANYTSPAINVMDSNGWFVFAVYPEVVTTNDVLQLILYDGSGSPTGSYTVWQSLVAGEWNYVYVEASAFSPAITSGLGQTMTRLQVTSGAGGSSYVFGGVWYVPKARPKIVIEFDDGWATQFSEAYAYMQTKALPGTIGVIAAQVGQANYCTLTQLLEMHRAGWDMAVHGDYQHTGAPLNNGLAAITADVQANRDYLTANGLTGASQHYIFPGGAVGTNSIPALQSLGFVTGRTTLANPISTVPLGLANAYRLTAKPYNQTSGVAALEAAIDQAIKIGATLILYGHQIVTPVTDANNQITPTDFRSVIDYIATKRDAGVVDVATVSEWYRGLRVY